MYEAMRYSLSSSHLCVSPCAISGKTDGPNQAICTEKYNDKLELTFGEAEVVLIIATSLYRSLLTLVQIIAFCPHHSNSLKQATARSL